ncbi:MAG: hypothetical protein WBX25_19050 [Rhodomicrobium sp.]
MNELEVKVQVLAKQVHQLHAHIVTLNREMKECIKLVRVLREGRVPEGVTAKAPESEPIDYRSLSYEELLALREERRKAASNG